jgi:hypothetical protein
VQDRATEGVETPGVLTGMADRDRQRVHGMSLGVDAATRGLKGAIERSGALGGWRERPEIA